MDTLDPLVLHEYLARLKARQLRDMRETDELAEMAWRGSNETYLLRRASLLEGRAEVHRESAMLAAPLLPRPSIEIPPPPTEPHVPDVLFPAGPLARLRSRLGRAFLAMARALGES